ncbi:hypothetical protein M885DRAFT_489790 [Pelagophyceae sp. CCMP2097]|nr:hypothetical protein M885DRAFT_489790 [Pelagophyceae sp. CCMP2097]
MPRHRKVARLLALCTYRSRRRVDEALRALPKGTATAPRAFGSAAPSPHIRGRTAPRASNTSTTSAKVVAPDVAVRPHCVRVGPGHGAARAARTAAANGTVNSTRRSWPPRTAPSRARRRASASRGTRSQRRSPRTSARRGRWARARADLADRR